jgi:glyoxylase-like metal-dependent hydrolase (beta-lactamase superfamily II)
MVTHVVNGHVVDTIEGAPWIRVFAVRTPTLPPATHTNVYIIGDAGDSVVVIDPASPWDDEQRALDAFLDGERVAEIWLTHHHVDHVSGAAHLAERLGVPVAAHRETAARLGSRVRIARFLDEGERLSVGARCLTALHTPGHAPGHICFHDRDSGALVAGDMVASVGTIIIEPDDGGDMADYLTQLRRLRALAPTWLLPSHGPPIRDVAGKLDFYVAHRLEREARVVAALSSEPRSVEELVPPAYPDVPPAIYPLAARSLLAHLQKLEREGRARRTEAGWTT